MGTDSAVQVSSPMRTSESSDSSEAGTESAMLHVSDRSALSETKDAQATNEWKWAEIAVMRVSSAGFDLPSVCQTGSVRTCSMSQKRLMSCHERLPLTNAASSLARLARPRSGLSSASSPAWWVSGWFGMSTGEMSR